MPELPEVETVRMQLEKHLVGQMLARIEVIKNKSLQGDQQAAGGRKITAVRRLGKMLVLDLSGKYCLAVHFKMSGQLILDQKSHGTALGKRITGGHPTEDWVRNLPGIHTRVIFYFQNGDVMYFNDQRMFGWVKVLRDAELANMAFVQKLGPEPWAITADRFYELIHRKNKPIKIVLMDQDIVSGVGNIYANDGLWEARVSPQCKANSLTQSQSAAILIGTIKVLKEGIRYGGATAADAKYINLDGLGGTYQEHFRTYAREGQPCLRRDGGVIIKTTLGGRGTFYCPECQK